MAHNNLPNHTDTNGHTPDPWATSNSSNDNDVAMNHVNGSEPVTPDDVNGFDQLTISIPIEFNIRPRLLHAIVPDDLLVAPGRERSFLEFPPDIDSADQETIRYLAVVTSIGEYEEATAVARTLQRCDVLCSTETCNGRGRLSVGQLVQLRHHLAGEYQGQTFIECAASECTPAVSLLGSRPASPPPLRPVSPVAG